MVQTLILNHRHQRPIRLHRVLKVLDFEASKTVGQPLQSPDPLSPPSPMPGTSAKHIFYADQSVFTGCFQGIVSCLRQDGSQRTQNSGVPKESALIPAALEHAVVIEHAAREILL